MASRRGPAWLVCLALGACAAPAPELPLDREVLAVDEFLVRYRDLECRRTLHCRSGAMSSWAAAAPELSCEDLLYGRFRALAGRFPSGYADEIALGAAHGALTFDPVSAAGCLDHLARTCTLDAVPLLGCEDVVVGTRPIGERCESRFECVPGAFCDAELGEHCGGVCAPLPAAGGPCLNGCESCEDGLCSYYAPTVVRTLHEPCGSEPLEPGALGRIECSGDLVCSPPRPDPTDPFSGRPATCELLPLEGQPCGAVAELRCAELLACVDDVCVATTVETTVGSACDDTAVLCDLAHGLFCKEGRCARVGGAEGTPCDPIWNGLDCDPDLRCHPVTLTCIVPRPDGTPCSESAECESGLCWAGRCDTREVC